MIRRHEATAAQAFFSTADAVSCCAEDQSNKEHVAGAIFAKNLVNYRLEHSIPWFLTVVGGYQDAMTTGAVISRQEWVFKSKEVDKEVPDLDERGQAIYDEFGRAAMTTEKETVVEQDHPDIVLLPTENFRFDPACDWRDPVKSSPYLIELMPMYVYQVKERMDIDNEKTGEKKWHRYTDGEITSAIETGNYDSTRLVREGQREDSKDIRHEVGLFDIVWVHRNIVNIEGDDWLYYTLGTDFLLSEPVPVDEVFLHGRPYAVGTANIETHKVYPAGIPELGQDLQAEANDIANGRLDNIKLILNKRHLVKRGTNVDWRALTTSTPGGVVLVDDLNHIKEEAMSDITSSSYQEQDRINVDFDELVGTFTQGSVQTNRSLNETVGGMNIAQDDSNLVSEYQLRIFVETWAERVLRQIVQMEIHYETDTRILALASGEYQAAAEIVEELIKVPMGVRVSIGFGSTSPSKRIEKMAIGLDTVAKFAPQKLQQLDGNEVVKEVFGALGFRDGSRFFKSEDQVDPQVAELQAQLQEAMEIIKTKKLE
ncbi:MAG: hypothetical protein KAT58_09835, partial [candidate division Zixibacteria bacterium]|nr:hypothetical protein [candidate division Zixibacteria bacterium]